MNERALDRRNWNLRYWLWGIVFLAVLGVLIPGMAVLAADPPYDTKTTITSVTSGHPDGVTLMVGFPVWVNVSVTSDEGTPFGDVTVSATGGLSCTATLNSGVGRCALFFTTSGSKSFDANYPGNSTYKSSQYIGYSDSISALSLNKTLSAGQSHTCVLNEDGSFICWGMPDFGPNDGAGHSVITSTVTTISAGYYHTCALMIDGTIKCWGDTPEIIAVPFGHYIDISSGADHACAVDVDGNLHCWGSSIPSPVPSGSFSAVSAGNLHDCALRQSDSKPVCWGDDTTAPDVALKAIAVGYTHACGIRSSNSSLVCWGTPLLTPPSGTNYNKVDSGSDYSCARNNSGSLSCWGTNNPVVGQSGTYYSFSSGFLHTCALKSKPGGGYYLACWGLDNYGQAPHLTLEPDAISAYLPKDRPWSQTYVPGGGAEPYTLAKSSGNFPTGLTLAGYILSGTPTNANSYTFSLKSSENFAASSLPLELVPLEKSYNTTVQDATTSVDFSCDPTSAPAGTPVLVDISVIKTATPVLSGTVTVTSDEPGAGCQVAVSPSGTAQCGLYFSIPGTRTIQAVYNGDDFYKPSDPPPASHQVTVEPVTINPMISAGNGFNCSLDATGQAYCWGFNDAGQASPPSNTFSQLSAGDAHACGRGLNGVITCWGWNGYGVANPPADAGFNSVTSGVSHACALRWDGAAICWGNPANDRTLPFTGISFTQISAGDNHTCGLDPVGYAACWGVDTYGQTTAPVETFSKISSGGSFTCGIRTSDSGLECWGGNGIIDSIKTEPVGLFIDLDAGYSHACAIRNDDTLVCWGDNTGGKATPPGGTFTSVSAGRDHTCAIRTDGRMLCWGDNAHGQAPSISILPHTLPTIDVNASWSTTLEVSGGREPDYSFSLVTGSLPPGLDLDASSGEIHGSPSQAGHFDFTIRTIERNLTPGLINEKAYSQTVRSDVQVEGILPLNPMVGLPAAVSFKVSESPGGSMGASPTLTVTVSTDDGKSCNFTIANDNYGTCYLFFTSSGVKNLTMSYVGDANFKPWNWPVQITVAPYQHDPLVRTGLDRTFVHKADGSLACVGTNCAQGNLNGIYTAVGVGDALVCVLRTDGTAFCKVNDAPSQVYPGPFTGLSVGKAHACAIKTDGTLSCWGENSAGQASPLGGSFRAVSAGATHTCGIRTDGTLACWGSFLGSVPGGTYTAVSAGSGHTCALSTAGSLACWGDDTYGQSTPPALGVFQAVSVGDTYSCALGLDGQITCWGEDTFGQATAPYGSFIALSSYADHNCALRSGPKLTCWGKNDVGEAPRILHDPILTPEIIWNVYWEHPFNLSGGTKPYQASISSGVLPRGMHLSLTMSPAGTILYGTPDMPGRYPFVIWWEDSAPIPLVAEHPYTLTVTGADLRVEILPSHPTSALFRNPFSFVYGVTNITSLAVPDILLSVDLPGGLSGITYSGMSGCTQAGQSLECPLASLDAFATQSLTVTGVVTAPLWTQIATSANVQPQLANWPETDPSDNSASQSVEVAYRYLVFEDDLDAPPLDPHWSGGTLVTSPNLITYLGDFTDSDAVRLVLNDLAPHQRVILSFDLYVIGPWQGNSNVPPSGVGLWQWGETGQPVLLSTTFCNQPTCSQAYPLSYPVGNFSWRALASGADRLGYVGLADTLYHLTYNFLHDASTLDLTFSSLNLPAGARWGLDHVRIMLDSGMSLYYLPVIVK